MLVYGNCDGCGATPCDHVTMLCDSCTADDMSENPDRYVDPDDPNNYCDQCGDLMTPTGDCSCTRG